MVMRDIKSVMFASKKAKVPNDDDDKKDDVTNKNFATSVEKATKGYKESEMKKKKNNPMHVDKVLNKKH